MLWRPPGWRLVISLQRPRGSILSVLENQAPNDNCISVVCAYGVPVLMAAANSSGGVMGKMIDAQSIMVACAACYDNPKERSFALGPIFRTVFWHSIAGAAVIGVIAMLQAYVFPGMIPIPPIGK